MSEQLSAVSDQPSATDALAAWLEEDRRRRIAVEFDGVAFRINYGFHTTGLGITLEGAARAFLVAARRRTERS